MSKVATLLLILYTSICLGQFKLSGTVISKNDNTPLPGVIIKEKVTENGTVSNFDGEFDITLSNEEAILVVSYLGFVPKEISVKGQTNIQIELKEDCTICWFDSQQIGLYLNSGVINNPIGGQFVFTFPDIKNLPRIRSSISYQTNLKDNRFLESELNLLHLFVSCEFNMDINFSYRNIDFEENIDLGAYSVETILNFKKITAITGFSSIDFFNVEKNKHIKGYGSVLGLGTWIHPLRLSVSAKTGIYKNLSEYEVEIHRGIRRFNSFLKFYKVNDFYELSIGAGFEFTYLFRKQKKE